MEGRKGLFMAIRFKLLKANFIAICRCSHVFSFDRFVTNSYCIRVPQTIAQFHFHFDKGATRLALFVSSRNPFFCARMHFA
jgi:hypothetical protein